MTQHFDFANLSSYDRAIRLAELGYYVVPLCWPNAEGGCGCGRGHIDNAVGKAPLTPHGANDATRDRDEIRRWFLNDFPSANIGVNAAKSGIIDIAPDCDEYKRTFREFGMPTTTLYRSSAGWHTWYRRPAGCPAIRVCKPAQYDIIADGNIAAPENAHPSGKRYALVNRLLAVSELPEAPSWAVEILRVNQEKLEANVINISAAERAAGNIQSVLDRIEKSLPARARLALAEPLRFGSYSEARYNFIGGLVRIGLTDDEIAAAVFHFADNGPLGWGHLEKKAVQTKLADISRVISKHEMQMMRKNAPRRIVPTRGAYRQPAARLSGTTGRKAGLTADQLLEFYQQQAVGGVVMISQSEVAKHFDVSQSTISRIEKQLHIERSSRRHISYAKLAAPDFSYAKLAAPEAPKNEGLELPDAEDSIMTKEDFSYAKLAAPGAIMHSLKTSRLPRPDTEAQNENQILQHVHAHPPHARIHTHDVELADEMSFAESEAEIEQLAPSGQRSGGVHVHTLETGTAYLKCFSVAELERALDYELSQPAFAFVGALLTGVDRRDIMLEMLANYGICDLSIVIHEIAMVLANFENDPDANQKERNIGAFGATEQAEGKRSSEASAGASYDPEADWTNSTTTTQEPIRAWIHSLKPSAYYTLRFGQQHALAFALDPSYVPDAADAYETETKLIAPDDPALAIKFYKLQGKMRKFGGGAQRFKLQIELEKLGRRVSLAEAEQIRLMRAAAKQRAVAPMFVELEAEP